MDSATATIVVGGLVGIGGLASALFTGFVTLRNSNRAIAAQVEVNRAAIAQRTIELSTHRDEVDSELGKEMRDELRTALIDTRLELTETRLEVKSCREEIASLRKDVENLTRESKNSQAERDRESEARRRAETASELFRVKLGKAEEEMAALRYELEQSRISLDAALRAQDAYSIAARERVKVTEESKGITP